jgi:hypothetical protein
MKTITRQELKAKLDVGADIKLVMWGCPVLTDRAGGSVRLPAG